jgi:hypothetical protein
MVKFRHILPARQHWTQGQLDLLIKHYPDTLSRDLEGMIGRDLKSIYAKASELGIKKSDAFKRSEVSGRTNGQQGVGTRFEKGLIPWNKGSNFVAGGRSAETRFKKGRPPAQAHNYQPIGSVRLRSDGYLELKMSDDPTIYPARRWVAVHRIVWEKHHGPIPKDFVVRFKTGMKTIIRDEITIDKLECLSRRDNMRLNSYHNNYPKEVAQLIQLRGTVQRKINRRLKNVRQD